MWGNGSGSFTFFVATASVCTFLVPGSTDKRLLPNVRTRCDRSYELLTARYEAACRPAEGCILSVPSREGHFDADAAKSRHDRALKNSGVPRFEPYVLRHTALTKLAARRVLTRTRWRGLLVTAAS